MNENDKEAEVVRCVQEERNSHQTIEVSINELLRVLLDWY